MMKRVLSSALMIFLLMASGAIAQNRPPKPPKPISPEIIQTVESVTAIIRSDYGFEKSGVAFSEDKVLSNLFFAGKFLQKNPLNPDSLIAAILDFPMTTEDHEIWRARIEILIPFRDRVDVNTFVHQAAQSGKSCQEVPAARVLAHWQEWSLALPLLSKNEAYVFLYDFRENSDSLPPSVRQTLSEGVMSGTARGRLSAGWAMNVLFHDTTALVSAARGIVSNADLLSDDEDYQAAKYEAIRALGLHGALDQVENIARMADDKNRLVRYTACDYLGLCAKNGDTAALNALKSIAEMNQDPDIRGSAKLYLSKLNPQENQR